MKRKISALIKLTTASLVALNLISCVPASTQRLTAKTDKKMEYQPNLASLRVNNRAGNGKEATQCIIWSIDEKKVVTNPGQDFVLVRPGDRSIKFTYQKWNKDKQQFTSMKPICTKGQLKPGSAYWLDAKTLRIEPAEGPCSAMVTDDQFVYAMGGQAKIRQMP